ncbi:ABC transporter ATP-binding protein [Photobacterium kishitanii]|uniref:ABC transporter ATP-binding protein n=1 Tax=Photobacterium kishitanii TaxID=318456 RepID=UPI002739C5CE|nr:ABC transporter ATP-binding protein [Photobacterium kishitanii]
MSCSSNNEELAIKVNALCKSFAIFEKPSHRLFQMLSGGKKKLYRDFHALNNVSFEVKKGETVGIIGRNGSGKSTLLQIICGTLNATSGEVTTYGKVAALLELGAGFNPEFTGRDNVYMAASIYGLSKEEIDSRFDNITKFADIGEHIEQPVKSYSSGMYVRLAFAVIAHVDADILIIDEALAVGDAVFTQKCMRFIRKFKENGTLLFVSHDMSSVLNLCKTAIWLDKGNVQLYGEAKEIGEAYLKYTLQETYGDEVVLDNSKDVRPEPIKLVKNTEFIDYSSEYKFIDNLNESNGWKTGSGEITSVNIFNKNDSGTNVFKGWDDVVIQISAKAFKDFEQPIIGFIIRDRLGQDLFGENTLSFTDMSQLELKAGQELTTEFSFKLPMLPNGQYIGMLSLANGTLHDNIQHHWMHDAFILNVSSSKVRWGLVGVPFDKINMSVK